MSRRDNNMDALRVAANIMVVVLHVSAVYVSQYLASPNAYFTFANLINSFTRISVPLFIMISGYFVLSNQKTADWRSFYKKTWHSIIIPTLIWSALYVVYSLILVRMNPSYTTLQLNEKYVNIFSNWASGQPFYHLWYLYMIMVMYAISPWLSRFLRKLNQQQIMTVGFVMLAIGMLISFMIKLVWIFSFIQYLGYFILGYSLKVHYQDKPSNGKWFWMMGLLAGLAVFIGTQLIVTQQLWENVLYLYSYLSPFVVIGALSIYIACVKLPPLTIQFNFLAHHSFNIYILHAGVLHTINLFNELFLHQNLNPYWFIPVGSVVVYSVSLGLSIIIYQINNIVKHKLLIDKL